MQSEPSTKHVLEGRELIDYLVEKASSTTNEELIRREDRRIRRSTISLSVVTFIGISGLVGAARLFIDQAVEQRTQQFRVEMEHNSQQLEQRIAGMRQESQSLQKLLTDQIDVLLAGISQQVERQVAQEATRGLLVLKHREQFHALKQFVAEIEEEVAENNFPENLLTAAVDTANSLGSAPEVAAEPQFQAAIETLVDLLVRSDRVREINRVEQAARETCVHSKDIALNLTDHYGQLIISSPYPVEQLASEYEGLSRYAAASRELKYPEKSIMWELFVEYKRNQYSKSSTTDEIVQMISSLNDADRRNFCYHMFLNSHPLHWENVPDHEGQMLAKLVGKLLQDYPTLRKTVEDEMASSQLRPLIDEVLSKKAERQARLAANSPASPLPQPADEAETADADQDSNLRR